MDERKVAVKRKNKDEKCGGKGRRRGGGAKSVVRDGKMRAQ